MGEVEVDKLFILEVCDHESAMLGRSVKTKTSCTAQSGNTDMV